MTKAELIKENEELKAKITKLQQKSGDIHIDLHVHHTAGDDEFASAFTKMFLAITREDDGGFYPGYIHLGNDWGSNKYRRLINKEVGTAIFEFYNQIRPFHLRAMEEGKKRGKSLLFQLNSGEITMNDFDSRL